MPKTIRIRYKDSHPSWPGDVAAHNGHNLAGGFHGPKYPGYEEDIPGDFLDDKIANKEYKNRDGSFDVITEMEWRKRIWETGGYHRQPGQKLYQPAPPHIPSNKSMLRMYLPPRKLDGQAMADLIWKTKVATLLFKEFSPLCMEFIGEIPEDAKALLRKKAEEEKQTKGLTYVNLVKGAEVVPVPDKNDPAKVKPIDDKIVDITTMDEINAAKFVKEVSDLALLKDYSAKESKRSRPRVAVAIEERIKELAVEQEGI